MMSSEEPSEETKNAWHKNPNNWKLGLFYFNKEDKRLLPPKRLSALGWTVNFANPYSVLILLLILLPFVVIFILAR